MHDSLVAKIAESFIKSADPFKAINTVLANLGESPKVKNPVPRHAVAPGIWLDFEANKNVVTTISPGDKGRGLRLNTVDKGSTAWFSFSYALPREAVQDGRYLGLLIEMESKGFAAFRPCLRYLQEVGFVDRFFSETIVSTGGSDDQLVFIKLDKELLAKATGYELLFFFEGRKFDITLRSVENLLIK